MSTNLQRCLNRRNMKKMRNKASDNTHVILGGYNSKMVMGIIEEPEN